MNFTFSLSIVCGFSFRSHVSAAGTISVSSLKLINVPFSFMLTAFAAILTMILISSEVIFSLLSSLTSLSTKTLAKKLMHFGSCLFVTNASNGMEWKV